MKPVPPKPGQHEHLDESQLQGLADSSLRGPSGALAREQIEHCAECKGAVVMYRELFGKLDTLTDPIAPPDFTLQVMEAVSEHTEQLAARRHIYLAAIPAVLVAFLAVIGWAWSAAPGQRLDQFVHGFTVCKQVVYVAWPALENARLPLASGALFACVALGVVLSRALRVNRMDGSSGGGGVATR